MQLHLIRHPRPVLDQRYCYGSSDIELADGELALCVNRLRAQLPRGLRIRSSPLRRCAGLALALARELDCTDIAMDRRLQEMGFGRWEQRTWDDIPWAEVEAWNRDLLQHAPGGGESLLTVARRVWAAFDELRRGEGDAIVVCHGGSIRMLRACAAWQTGQAGQATPDAAAFDMIASNAAADRQAPGFGELTTLEIATLPAQRA
ncbi:histidine phosphatase family protein [Herbaspirillum robiniae]|uniref:histidine phosphatase family protein n=1 Tax=Herbaspirillum robiniae TaxID=2014887 RepID=UPI003D784078